MKVKPLGITAHASKLPCLPHIELQFILVLLVQASEFGLLTAKHPWAVVWTCFAS